MKLYFINYLVIQMYNFYRKVSINAFFNTNYFFRIISWFFSIFQLLTFKKHKLMDLNIFDVFESIGILFMFWMCHAWPAGASSNWPLRASKVTWVDFTASLLSDMAECFRLILYIFPSNLKSVISPRKWYLVTIIWGLRAPHCCYVGLLIPGFFSGQN